ncbi:hypothetical protein HYR99_30075 [Candidatus Poribacteria bacterium]|nr:hypothetical protein [Candidatus Poribacteria bacterium]
MKNKLKENYGPYFDWLSEPEKRAVEKYIWAMAKHYPQLAEAATAGPGNEGEVYVYIPRPPDEDEDIKIHKKMSKIGLNILMDTGVSILVMPEPKERCSKVIELEGEIVNGQVVFDTPAPLPVRPNEIDVGDTKIVLKLRTGS